MAQWDMSTSPTRELLSYSEHAEGSRVAMSASPGFLRDLRKLSGTDLTS